MYHYTMCLGVVSAVLTHDFEGTDDDQPLFMFNSFEKWLERQKVPLPRVSEPKKAHLWLSDFRKFAEQFGDIIGGDATNRKYVLAQGMTGVDWEHYKHPLAENIYDVAHEELAERRLHRPSLHLNFVSVPRLFRRDLRKLRTMGDILLGSK